MGLADSGPRFRVPCDDRPDRPRADARGGDQTRDAARGTCSVHRRPGRIGSIVMKRLRLAPTAAAIFLAVLAAGVPSAQATSSPVPPAAAPAPAPVPTPPPAPAPGVPPGKITLTAQPA